MGRKGFGSRPGHTSRAVEERIGDRVVPLLHSWIGHVEGVKATNLMIKGGVRQRGRDCQPHTANMDATSKGSIPNLPALLRRRCRESSSGPRCKSGLHCQSQAQRLKEGSVGEVRQPSLPSIAVLSAICGVSNASKKTYRQNAGIHTGQRRRARRPRTAWRQATCATESRCCSRSLPYCSP